MNEYIWIIASLFLFSFAFLSILMINPNKVVAIIKKCFKLFLDVFGISKGEKHTMNNTNVQIADNGGITGGVNVTASTGGVVNISGNNRSDLSKDTLLTHKGEGSENNECEPDYSEIKLEAVYTSLFAEDNRLKTEQIIIETQDHGNIEGRVLLVEKGSGRDEHRLTYKLVGKFNNKVLTAEYISVDKRMDERGTINLKLIGNDLLSGFCSFSRLASTDDEIRVSPYVWVAGKNKDLLNGTYPRDHA